jgi:hypothetical protein
LCLVVVASPVDICLGCITSAGVWCSIASDQEHSSA